LYNTKNGDYFLFYLRVYIYSGLLASEEALKRGVKLLKSPQEKHRNTAFVSFLGTISTLLDTNPQIKINGMQIRADSNKLS
jgi:hypothetical protein